MAEGGLGVIHMLPSWGFRYLALTRRDFSGWARGPGSLRRATSEIVARLLWKDIVYRRAEDQIEYSTCQLCFGRIGRRAVLM